ncbi:LOW QUALITY PROTEIN: rho GTPase-activating protein 36 [Clupea harengus]|uniref:LOW QUALITY PROTEIN: rho GTPase-activating protein 36 n=1 Tax=Clupea harengus TaxID=7950 RepID=A0A8M1KV74_CLUHA|nr:LOW QUALITY PROTEIN: rho GTPase-activating protein 36 [Clupea harengus]
MVSFYVGSDGPLPTVMLMENPVRQDMQFYYVGDHTWTTMLGQSVKLQPVPIQSLSELERARLQEVALYHLEERELDFRITIPREIHKRRKSLRRKFDSFSKEKKERETSPRAFGLPLWQVIANDRAHKQRQDALKESRRDCLDLEASVLRFRAEQCHPHGNLPLCSLTATPGAASSSVLELHNKPLSPTFLDNNSRVHRRGGLSVDSISDLVESQSRLLEALQLSHPKELDIKKASAGRTQTKLSLNPIYCQVPRVVERCCRHMETHGLQTVGIFRVGSSKKRVRQLRDDFDSGVDVVLDEEHSVHDVAALLKEFLRDMPDPLLPRELYSAFLHANTLRGPDQLNYLQQLLYLLPPCNCDTLLRLLTLLHTVQEHAQDITGPDQQEILGNKMTATNLAVIFGPNLLQKDRELSMTGLGIEDSAVIISVTFYLIQNYQRLFTVSAELQQEVLMSLIQTDPDIIDYLLRRKLSGSPLTEEAEGGSEQRNIQTLGLVGQLSGDLSPLEPPSPLFPDSPGGGSLSSEVFFNVMRLNSRKRSSGGSGKSIGHLRQFHSHHNLLSLAQPSPIDEQEPQEPQERRTGDGLASPGEGLHFSLGLESGSSFLQSPTDSSVWVRQAAQTPSSSTTSLEESKQPTNFWDFFTGKWVPFMKPSKTFYKIMTITGRSPPLPRLLSNQSRWEKS